MGRLSEKLQLIDSWLGSEVLVLTGLAGFNRTLSRHSSPSQLLSSYQQNAYQLPCLAASSRKWNQTRISLTATSYGKQLIADNSPIAMSGQSLLPIRTLKGSLGCTYEDQLLASWPTSTSTSSSYLSLVTCWPNLWPQTKFDDQQIVAYLVYLILWNPTKTLGACSPQPLARLFLNGPWE